MKAFLSHSSRDKSLVSKVFEDLGAASAIYDVESFEDGKRSAEEIFRSLTNSDLFVLFVSGNSLASDWVQHELRVAYDRYASGRIKEFLAFVIDDTNVRQLPEWLQAFHVRKTRKSRLISRRIRSVLIELSTVFRPQPEVFVGRSDQLAELKIVLSAPPAEGPSIIGVCGWPGIGRRTLARKLLAEVYPYLPHLHPEVIVSSDTTIDDFYRNLLDASSGLALEEWKRENARFLQMSHRDKVSTVVSNLRGVYDEKEVLFLLDDGGLIRDDGEYVEWFADVLSHIGSGVRPLMVLIQRRMLPHRLKHRYRSVHLVKLPSFSEDEIRTLLGLFLRGAEIDYTSDQLKELSEYMGGHPLNARYAFEFAKQYGLRNLLSDKTDLVQFSIERASDILLKVPLMGAQEKVSLLLSDYRILDLDTVVDLVAETEESIAVALRALQDNAIVERIGKYYRIAPYVREALSRHFRDYSDKAWREEVARRMAEAAENYEDIDEVPLPVIDAAIIANFNVRPDRPPAAWVAELVLPSHLLRVARNAYDDGQHELSAQFCEQALQRSSIMTIDAQVETLRLLAISLARLARENQFWAAVNKLQKFNTRAARRNYHFLCGFWYRRIGKLDIAEEKYLEAYALDARNFHVLRELATCLSYQGRFSQAEAYARSAYMVAPTNPYIVDCLCDIIIGQSQNPSELQHNEEFQHLMEDLKRYGSLEGRSFYENRFANYLFRLGRCDEALKYAEEGVLKTPWLFGAYLTRARIRLGCGQIDSVPGDIEDLRRLSEDTRTGEGKASRFLIDNIEIRYKAIIGDYFGAFKLLERYREIPNFVKKQVALEVANMVLNDQGALDMVLIESAEKIIANYSDQ